MPHECKLFYVSHTAVCRRKCSNGGKCVAPNKCSCRRDYKGRRCQKGKVHFVVFLIILDIVLGMKSRHRDKIL